MEKNKDRNNNLLLSSYHTKLYKNVYNKQNYIKVARFQSAIANSLLTAGF